MLTYKLQTNLNGDVIAIQRSDGWSIPIAQGNTDYQEYLKWLAEGNEPLPADEPA